MAKGDKRERYRRELRELQIELVKFQNHLIKHDLRVAVLIEGRDGAGKDGTIKRVVEHLSPRDTRVVALGKPSDRERTEWYFQRYVPHLPAAQEFVLFNRSWYNRAGVERVMGFCTDEEYEAFLRAVPVFERMLTDGGVRLLKYYLDIGRDEQERRLEDRRRDPLKQWKVSPIDEAATERWDDYSRARDAMFERTHSDASPWFVVRADDKRAARLEVIRHLLSELDYRGKDERLLRPPAELVFPFHPDRLRDGSIAR